MSDSRPLVVHVLYRFDVGGLENGVANLIDRLSDFRHAILALDRVTDYRHRIRRDDVLYISLHKPPGHLFPLYPRLYRIFRQLRPSIVHSRNLAALEVSLPAWAAGVPVRIHGEHGRDVGDLDGSNRLYQWVRRLYAPFISHWIALSKDLERYLTQRVGIQAHKVSHICNGVDATRFFPAHAPASKPKDCPFIPGEHWLVGTVGRMQAVKNQTLLARAFIEALARMPAMRERLRLVMVGDGPLRDECMRLLSAAGVEELGWLPGERYDVAEIFRLLDCFVLPSLAEGISNTILEAMASGLPVIATRVGGNPELIQDGMTGRLVPNDDVEAMAEAILEYAQDPALARQTGAAGRKAVERHFSLEVMARHYADLYRHLMSIRGQ